MLYNNPHRISVFGIQTHTIPVYQSIDEDDDENMSFSLEPFSFPLFFSLSLGFSFELLLRLWEFSFFSKLIGKGPEPGQILIYRHTLALVIYLFLLKRK